MASSYPIDLVLDFNASTVDTVDKSWDNAARINDSMLSTVSDTLQDMVSAIDDIGGAFNRAPDIDVDTIRGLDDKLAELGIIDPRDKPGDISAKIAEYLSAIPSDVYNPGAAPDVDSKLEAPEFKEGDLPTLDADKPDLKEFPAPDPFTPDKLGDVPDISDPDMPDLPPEDLPPVPTFDDFVLPDTPDFDIIPPFNETAPVFDVTAPSPSIVFNEEEYVSELKDRAEAWLQNIIVNGGTGLAAAVEQAIWERGMAREVLAARRNIENAIDEFAESGFPAPPGALRARTEAVRQELQNRAEDLSRKILEEQARLAQDNTQFAVDKGVGFVAMEMEHHRAVMERAFQLARATVDNALAVFNAKIASFNARIDSYKTKAQIYEINVRAALQQLEQYRTLLEGKRIEASLRQQEVDLYRAQISGVEALFGLYRTQLEGVRTQVDVDRARIDGFKSKVESSALKIRAKEAEYGLHQAQLDGEKNKVDLYRSQVDAYISEIQGEAEKYNLKKSHFDAKVKMEGLRVDEWKVKMGKYAADLDKNKTAVAAFLDQFRSKNALYSNEIQKATAEEQLGIELLKIEQDRARFNNSEINETNRLIAKLVQEENSTRIQGYGMAVDAASKVSSAALSMINTIASMTEDTGESTA